MKMTVYEKEIDVDDKLVEIYNNISKPHQLDSEMMDLLIYTEQRDAETLGREDLEKLANTTLYHVLKELEILSRPETFQKVAEFYKKKMQESE